VTISGEQGEDKEGGGLGRSQAISSPWDVTRVGPTAFAIAMAGSHQVRTGLWPGIRIRPLYAYPDQDLAPHRSDGNRRRLVYRPSTVPF
jgi:hypothetical protein